MLLRLVTTAALFATSTLIAQTPVTLRCTPTDGSAAGCYYCPGFEHVIKWNGTQLLSPTVNMLAFHDLDVLITGTWDGTAVTVNTVQLDPESFSISGGGHIGHDADFNTVGAPGGLAINLAALSTSFSVPLLELAMQLNLLGSVSLGAGVIDSGGEFTSTLPVPNNPNLIGVKLFGQGLILTTAGGIYTTNIDAKELN